MATITSLLVIFGYHKNNKYDNIIFDDKGKQTVLWHNRSPRLKSQLCCLTVGGFPDLPSGVCLLDHLRAGQVDEKKHARFGAAVVDIPLRIKQDIWKPEYTKIMLCLLTPLFINQGISKLDYKIGMLCSLTSFCSFIKTIRSPITR